MPPGRELQQDGGSFGDMHSAQFDDDGAAVRFGQSLLEDHPAVDIWTEGRRIALISTPFPRHLAGDVNREG